MAEQGLVYGPLGPGTLHLCVDMQRVFGPGYPWAMPWLERVTPAIERLCERHADRTLFTRFIPAAHPGEGRGTWGRYYERWADITLEKLGTDAVRLVPALERFVPPAKVLDKHVYAPWTEGKLDAMLSGSGVDTLVITGGETDVCVLASALGGIDRGYRVVLVGDALCSFVDETHDALMELYLTRFTEQLEVTTVDEVLENWR
ncbi:cysteine hydrolase [Pleomorphomonas diazotrophica]|uniref:Cysteine hydrolase n=1 Tax=Pleomorphomonas diazotrophica TaxID=1166257 RepID=A0A1I4QTT1_9HYPH|nr:isochorismatase family cysteine hydrolase [Pleomorphomonas diazotrophica]PKR90432.1 cysteine hydrolase [Pleomorphomonas diazotrophica]SFM43417.1 Nicotinamidase-related amidase [Pleomorphomonas diazotrophica]